jgi:hypothetical protein
LSNDASASASLRSARSFCNAPYAIIPVSIRFFASSRSSMIPGTGVSIERVAISPSSHGTWIA